jgi:type VII secretion-associated serine protease mycosin
MLAAPALAVLIGIPLGALGGAAPAHADSIRSSQWQLRALDAEDAWAESTGNGVLVGVIDSGVDAEHPDLRGQVVPGIDLVDGGGDGRTDVLGHGTSVASFIAGRGDDRRGVVGLAYDAKILPIRVLNPQNRYESAEVLAKAIRYAVDKGAKVVNLSLGSATTTPAVSDALTYAFSKDVVVVSCAGNVSGDQGSTVWHPAREPGVIAVTGTTRNGSFWSGSLRGSQATLAAPSVALTGAYPGGQYWQVEGTSFAAPLVSASAALIRSRYPDMRAPDVINRLIKTARDLGPPGRDPLYGFGRVDPADALTVKVASVRSNPLLPAGKPSTDGTGRAGAVKPVPNTGSDSGVAAAPGGDGRSALPWIVVGLAAATLIGTGSVALLIAARRRRSTGDDDWVDEYLESDDSAKSSSTEPRRAVGISRAAGSATGVAAVPGQREHTTDDETEDLSARQQ